MISAVRIAFIGKQKRTCLIQAHIDSLKLDVRMVLTKTCQAQIVDMAMSTTKTWIHAHKFCGL